MGLRAMGTQECQEPSDTLWVTHAYVGGMQEHPWVFIGTGGTTQWETMPAVSSIYCFTYRLTLERPGQSQMPPKDSLKGGCTLGSALE